MGPERNSSTSAHHSICAFRWSALAGPWAPAFIANTQAGTSVLSQSISDAARHAWCAHPCKGVRHLGELIWRCRAPQSQAWGTPRQRPPRGCGCQPPAGRCSCRKEQARRSELVCSQACQVKQAPHASISWTGMMKKLNSVPLSLRQSWECSLSKDDKELMYAD